MNGVIIVDKPQEFTSFDVVAKLRGIFGMKKLGHAGTLDPNATGVLPVFVGSATKLCDWLLCEEKIYEAELLLGTETDTEDIWGTVTRETDPSLLSEAEVREAILSFQGEYEQIPPMYSAKKVNGQKLYELARKQVVIPRKPVSCRIDRIEITKMCLPRVKFTVSCTKGTYIRSLCRDMGTKLSQAACMSSLRRTRHGRFVISEAHTLQEIQEAKDRGTLSDLVIPVENLFLDLPELLTTEAGSKGLMNGNQLSVKSFRNEPEPADGKLYRVYDIKGTFRAVYRYDASEEVFVPGKMFLTE